MSNGDDENMNSSLLQLSLNGCLRLQPIAVSVLSSAIARWSVSRAFHASLISFSDRSANLILDAHPDKSLTVNLHASMLLAPGVTPVSLPHLLSSPGAVRIVCHHIKLPPRPPPPPLRPPMVSPSPVSSAPPPAATIASEPKLESLVVTAVGCNSVTPCPRLRGIHVSILSPRLPLISLYCEACILQASHLTSPGQLGVVGPLRHWPLAPGLGGAKGGASGRRR